MSNRYLEILTQIVRHPRHLVQGSDHLVIEVERAQPLADAAEQPDVMDFSRGGCRLRWSSQLNKNEPIVLRISDTSSGLALELPGTVRWSRDLEDGRTEAGCQFDQEVDYEYLGELFIAGFLSMEEVSPPT